MPPLACSLPTYQGSSGSDRTDNQRAASQEHTRAGDTPTETVNAPAATNTSAVVYTTLASTSVPSRLPADPHTPDRFFFFFKCSGAPQTLPFSPTQPSPD